MALIQDVLIDTLAARAESLDAAVDTVADSPSLSEEIGEAGRALATGEFDYFGSVVYERIAAKLVDFVPSLVSALLIFLLLYVSYRVIHRVLRQMLNRTRRVDPGLQHIILKTFRIVSVTIIIVMVLDQFGFAITTLLAGLGIAGIAVGFAARDTLENFIAGITILMAAPSA